MDITGQDIAISLVIIVVGLAFAAFSDRTGEKDHPVELPPPGIDGCDKDRDSGDE
jgi:hypothetical protein